MGIYSYADLSANYQGYLFFKELTHSKNPYFVCEQDKWKKVRVFDISQYLDASWDERINCNRLRDTKLLALFSKRLLEIEKDQNHQEVILVVMTYGV